MLRIILYTITGTPVVDANAVEPPQAESDANKEPQKPTAGDNSHELLLEGRTDSNLSSASSSKDAVGSKGSKKRKANSRTPTPNSIVQTDADRSVTLGVAVTQNSTAVPVGSAADRRDSIGSVESAEKPKKVMCFCLKFGRKLIFATPLKLKEKIAKF